MTALKELYLRLDLLQRGRRFHLVASALALLVGGIVFGMLLTTSYRLDGQRSVLVQALTGQNLEAGDEHAVSLQRSGTVTVVGRTYGGETYLRNADLFFDDGGTITAPAALAEHMLADQRPAWAPVWMLEQPETTWIMAVLTILWWLLVIWLDLTLPAFLTGAAVAVAMPFAWLIGGLQGMLAVWGIGLLTFTFLLLTRLLLVLFSLLMWLTLQLFNRPSQLLAVAQTVVREASRRKISLVFIIVLLVILPLLPIWLDPDAPLRFQIQTFISRSMGLTFLLAACMTLFLSCASVAFEIRDRQIWQLMTKPLSRVHYLVGKWLGVVTVNLILLLVSGVSIFLFIQFLRQQPVASGMRGQLDALAVRDEVLTARGSLYPSYDTLEADQLRARVEQVVQRMPELTAEMGEVPLATLREIATALQAAYMLGQRTVPPQVFRNFLFTGLQDARRRGGTLTLRYRFHILRSDEHEAFQAYFWFNDDRNMLLRRTYVPTMAHLLPIPTQLIREDGTLLISVFNPYVPRPDKPGLGALNFEMDDFELLYKVGDFEPNFLKAMLVNWTKLSFLAMLGVCCATFLSFSVSCLLSFTVFVAGAMGPFLADSLAMYSPPVTSEMDWGNVALVIQWAFQWTIKAIASALVWLLRGFGELSASSRLVEGRYIPWGAVGLGFLKLGVVWSGLTLIVGFLIIRARQLAVYSGQG